MQFSLKVFTFVASVALFKGYHAYDHKDQAAWYDIDGAECSFKRQSPIELNSLDALPSYDLSSIKFINYNANINSEITNNGHSADLKIPLSHNIAITGGPLGAANYVAESLHFHWGSRNYHGAEHVVDNHRSSVEMHIVHRNSKYADVSEATNHPDGLSVLGIFYDVASQEDFFALQNIVESLQDIIKYNTSTEVYDVVLSELLGDIDTEEFYTYQGSLTTPPCSQAVTWIVFPQCIQISEHQIASFRALKDSHGNALVNNYRHLQAKGFRPLYLRRYNNLIF